MYHPYVMLFILLLYKSSILLQGEWEEGEGRTSILFWEHGSGRQVVNINKTSTPVLPL